MKTTFIYLGILVTMFSNSIFANGLNNQQNYQESNSSDITYATLSNGTNLKKPALELETDTFITSISNYKKTIEEVIIEDNKIIESEIDADVTSASDEIIKKIIKEDNQIIESYLTNG